MSQIVNVAINETIGLRESIRSLQESFQKIVVSTGQNFSQAADKIISQVIQKIKMITGKIDKTSFEKLIFLLGATGAGKSTLINYIATKGENFYVYATDGDNALIRLKDNSISEIGGKQPTTIFPVPYALDEDTFLDCAGDGDTGLIIEIINSIIKSKISENVKQAKILIVSTYSSLGSENGYGRPFKMALEKNAQFMGDIDEFKENIGFVITRAPLAETAMQESVEKLIAIGKHADMSGYKDVISQIVSHNKISLFCGPENKKKGSDYVPPSWNADQWNTIIRNINGIPYKQIPNGAFFKISTNEKIRQALNKAMQIKIFKATQLIQETIKNILPLKICSVELQRVTQFISGLMIGCETTFSEFFKVLQWNNYLNAKVDLEQVDKISSQIEYLHQFTHRVEDKSSQNVKSSKINWSSKANLTNLLSKAYEDCQKIVCSKQNYIFNHSEEGLLLISAVKPELSNLISEDIKQLNLRYKEQQQTNLLGEVTSSKYYKDQVKTQIQNTIQQAYQQKQNRIQQESYQQWVGPTYQTVTQYVTKSNPVIKYKTQKVYESQFRQKKVSKTRVEYYTESVKHSTRVFGFKGSPYYTQEQRSRIVPYDDWEQQIVQVPKEKSVAYTAYQNYQEAVQKVKEKTPGHHVTKQRPVAKEVEVTKYRPKHIYREFTVRVLDQVKLQQDKTKCLNQIQTLRTIIEDHISKYPKGQNNSACPKLQIYRKEETEQMYKDLLEKWRDAEYDAYFCENPEKSLEPCSLETMLAQVSN